MFKTMKQYGRYCSSLPFDSRENAETWVWWFKTAPIQTPIFECLVIRECHYLTGLGSVTLSRKCVWCFEYVWLMGNDPIRRCGLVGIGMDDFLGGSKSLCRQALMSPSPQAPPSREKNFLDAFKLRYRTLQHHICLHNSMLLTMMTMD